MKRLELMGLMAACAVTGLAGTDAGPGGDRPLAGSSGDGYHN